jgi:hypothetical protein
LRGNIAAGWHQADRSTRLPLIAVSHYPRKETFAHTAFSRASKPKGVTSGPFERKSAVAVLKIRILQTMKADA